MRILIFSLLILVVAGVSVASPLRQGAHPWIPLDANPTWQYHVRLWEFDPTSPDGLHELTPEEFEQLGEEQDQTVTILRYDPPNPIGDTIYGVYHSQLNFVLWMQYIPGDKNHYDRLAQIGETAKDTYDPSLTPAENDEQGHIDWFFVNDKWYPRTWSYRIGHPNQAWKELWGPFGDNPDNPILLPRNYTVSFVPITFDGKHYTGIKVTIVGPSEGDPNVIATESYTFIDGIGMYERYFDLTTNVGVGQNGQIITLFKHIATLQEVSFN